MTRTQLGSIISVLSICLNTIGKDKEAYLFPQQGGERAIYKRDEGIIMIDITKRSKTGKEIAKINNTADEAIQYVERFYKKSFSVKQLLRRK